MRGTRAIVGFGLLGLLALGLAWYANENAEWWCGDRIPQCGTDGATAAAIDLWVVGLLIAGCIVGLLAVSLAANGLLRLVRGRRAED